MITQVQIIRRSLEINVQRLNHLIEHARTTHERAEYLLALESIQFASIVLGPQVVKTRVLPNIGQAYDQVDLDLS